MTLSYFFNGTCHKTQSQTNHHPSIDRHSRRGQPLPPSICLLITCELTPSLHSFPVINFYEEGGWSTSFLGKDNNCDRGYEKDCHDGAITATTIFHGYKLDDEAWDYCYYPLAATAPVLPLWPKEEGGVIPSLKSASPI